MWHPEEMHNLTAKHTWRSFLGEKRESCSIHARECWEVSIPVLRMALDMLECAGTDKSLRDPKAGIAGIEDSA